MLPFSASERLPQLSHRMKHANVGEGAGWTDRRSRSGIGPSHDWGRGCLLYTSDAADE